MVIPPKTENLPVISAAAARRWLLHAQGLADDPARRATQSELVKTINRMGFVQIDSINVVERAHHLTLFSRLDGYRQTMLPKVLEERRSFFEHWTHDASVIPIQWLPHWRHRFERYRARIRRHAWWRTRLGENPQELLAQVKQRIIDDGPLLSKDFERSASPNGQPPAEEGWWGWKPQKAALEHLWRTGELAVLRRVHFQKVYDLTERVFPEHHGLPASDESEHVDWACGSALERLGVATPGEIVAFWDAIEPVAGRRWCDQALRKGEIVAVVVESADGSKPRMALTFADWERRSEASANSDLPQGMRLLSPFDPVVRDRKRARRLFNFDYSFEAFVPAAKRKYGYYVLPILEGDRLIGRLDPKFHRDQEVLEIKGLWWEPGVKTTKQRRIELDEAVQRLADFIGAERIRWST